MKGMVPCGECAAYVDADRGCYHWRPQHGRAPALTSTERSRRYNERKRAAKREQRSEAVAVQAPAQAVVSEYRRMMLAREV